MIATGQAQLILIFFICVDIGVLPPAGGREGLASLLRSGPKTYADSKGGKYSLKEAYPETTEPLNRTFRPQV
ncbi:MAG: hypothetical protein ACI87O_002119 [Planctomycetota bacterium]|jgi:hypothetical protein